MTAKQVLVALREVARDDKAEFLPGFFQAMLGGYGEGDRFLGCMVPDQRKVARQFQDLTRDELLKLFTSPWHECRLTLESNVVQDSDRLDALGAIGIVRTIEYGAAFGQPFYLADGGEANTGPVKTGVAHFHEKLFKLKSLMNADAGRRMAKDREAFLQTFLDHFMRQNGDRSGSSERSFL